MEAKLGILKNIIFMNHRSFKRIEEYLAHVKELQPKFGECGKHF